MLRTALQTARHSRRPPRAFPPAHRPFSPRGLTTTGPSPPPPTDPSPDPDPSPETIPSSSIRILRTVPALRAWRRAQLLAGRTVGLVPTMGALHAGHLDLVRAAARDTRAVVVSLYVNPAQFGLREDLASYPASWAADCAALAALDGGELAGLGGGERGGEGGRVAVLFAPRTQDMYPSGFPGQEVGSAGSFVTITPVGGVLEGAARPTFFRGVATVCMKLLCAATPERAYFGQKDVQQTVVVRRMVRDFLVDTEIVVRPTTREVDGLAMSSRNVYLGTRRRGVATVLNRALTAAEGAYASGKRETGEILGEARRVTDATVAEESLKPARERVKFEVDYIALSDPETMEEIRSVDPTKGAILSGAVKMLPVEEPQEGEDLGHSGGPVVRLIDNIILKPSTGTAF